MTSKRSYVHKKRIHAKEGNYIKDDLGRLYFFCNPDLEPELRTLKKATFPTSTESIKAIQENLLELIFMQIVGRLSKNGKDVPNGSPETNNRDIDSYNEVVIKYPFEDKIVEKDIMENLISESFGTPKSAWFYVKTMPISRNKSPTVRNDDIVATTIPYPYSGNTRVSFLNGRLVGVCKQGTDASNAAIAINSKAKTGRIFLEFEPVVM